MRNLLRSDLKRVIKDKLFLIAAIIAGAYAFVSPLIYKGVFALLADGEDMLEAMGAMPTAKSLFFQSLLPGGDMGLIIPILVIIALCKDFSYGTVRNKIIAGHSRTSIFLSMLITCTVIMCSLMLSQALITLFTSLLFFEYSSVAFSVSELGYLLISILFELLTYVTVCSIICFFCVFMKNAGTSVVMYFTTSFVLALFGSIFMIASMGATPGSATANFLEIMYSTNIFASSAIGGGTSYELKDVLYILIPNITFSALLIFLGIKVFNKKDLK